MITYETYECEYCGQEFDDEFQCEKHENHCCESENEVQSKIDKYKAKKSCGSCSDFRLRSIMVTNLKNETLNGYIFDCDANEDLHEYFLDGDCPNYNEDNFFKEKDLKFALELEEKK